MIEWLVCDHPDALGETLCWRASLILWCLLLSSASLTLRKVGGR